MLFLVVLRLLLTLSHPPFPFSSPCSFLLYLTQSRLLLLLFFLALCILIRPSLHSPLFPSPNTTLTNLPPVFASHSFLLLTSRPPILPPSCLLHLPPVLSPFSCSLIRSYESFSFSHLFISFFFCLILPPHHFIHAPPPLSCSSISRLFSPPSVHLHPSVNPPPSSPRPPRSGQPTGAPPWPRETLCCRGSSAGGSEQPPSASPIVTPTSPTTYTAASVSLKQLGEFLGCLVSPFVVW